MTQLGISIAWLVLSPLALVTNIIAIVIVCHYQGQFHGTDVAFLSLFVTMMMEAVAVVPVPAVLSVLDAEEDWRWSQLCSAYVWLVLCVRMSDLLVMLIVNVHWMCILRFTSGQEVYSSSTAVKIFVIIAWVAAMVTGIVPAVGHSFYTYYQEVTSKKLVVAEGNSPAQLVTVVRRECHFLPEGLGFSFILFFILLTLAVLVLSLVASCDTLTVFHYMKKTAVHKYKAGRFYLPSSALLDTATNKNLEAEGADTPITRNSLSNGEERLNRESQAVDVTSSNHQNNGGLATVHKNGSIPGEGAGHSPSATTSTGDIVSRSLDGDLPTAGEDAATNRHSNSLYGNGASGSASVEIEGGERRLVRSAATVVVRPSVKSGVAKSNPTTVHARYNELNLSAELCRVVFCFTLLAALINHLPFVVLQFLQLVQEVDRQHAETTVLWLTLAHSLALPHVLWLLSRRYRHALAYTWKVHVLRDRSAREEDPSACTLQSYTRRVVSPEGGTLKVMARSRGREPITMATYESSAVTPNGNAICAERNSRSSPAVRGTWSRETDRNHETEEPFPNISGQGARTEVMTTDLDDGMTIVTNLASHQVTYIYNTPPDQSPNTHESSECSDNNRKLSEDQSNSGEPAGGRKDGGIPSQGHTRCDIPSEGRRSSTMSSEGRGNSSASSPATNSPSRSSLGTPTRGSTDINRSASARKVWKEQMMKKHLPAIFINEAFESDELMYEERVGNEVSQLPDVTQVTEVAKTQSSSDDKKNPQFNYYMSGNFHYDYLRSDSLPRMESESDGGSFQYDDNDIEGILDREHSMRSQRVTPNMTTFLGNSQESAPVDDAVKDEAGHSSTDTHDVKSDGDTTVSNSGTWPRSVPMTQNEDSKSGSVTRTPGSRKPRRSAAILKHSKRPSLQHQTSLHTDPERSGEDTSVEPGADSEHISPDSASVVENNLTERTFYPTFQPTDRTSEVIPTSDSSGGHKEADENRHQLNFGQQPSNVLTSSSKSIGETVHDDIKAVDTDDVFINIENVTTDATHTDTVCSVDRFVPQGQASVLGILLEDGTEIPAHVAVSDNSSTFPDSPNPVQEADEFDHISDSSPGPLSPFNPFNDHEHIANSQTNPFFADFSTDRQTSTGLELAPLPPEYQPVSSSADSHSADDTNFFREMENTSFSESQPFRPSPFDVGNEGPVVSHIDSDRATPDTAVVRDAEETNSLDSEPSVVLEPYNVDRRPPWMDAEFEDSAPVSPRKRSRNPFRASFDVDDSDALGSSGDFGSSFGSNSEIRNIFSNQTKADCGNPFALDSFSDKFTDDAGSDFPQSSVDSGQLIGVEHNGSTMFQSYPFFDEETDRGFEDALALENVIGASPYFGHFSQRFESIEEEPEDLTDSPVEKESSKVSEPADVSHDSSMHISTTELPETNPFGNMNGNSSLSSSSDPSPVFASTNPFSPHNSPERSIPFDYGEQTVPTSYAETVSVQSPFYQEPVQQKGDMPASIADTSEEKSNITEEKSNITDTSEEKSNITETSEEKSNITDTSEEKSNITTSAPAPRIHLTKPIPWKLKDGKPNGNDLGSDVLTSRNALAEQKGLGSRTNSKDDNSVEFDSSFSRTNNEDLFTGSDGDHPTSGSHHTGKPPVPPRPSKEGKVDAQSDESSADYVDPVFF